MNTMQFGDWDYLADEPYEHEYVEIDDQGSIQEQEERDL